MKLIGGDRRSKREACWVRILQGTGFDVRNPIGYGASEAYLKKEGKNEGWGKVAVHPV